MRKQSIPGCLSPPMRPGYEATLSQAGPGNEAKYMAIC